MNHSKSTLKQDYTRALRQLHDQIAQCLGRDRRGLRKRLRQAHSQLAAGNFDQQALDQLQQRFVQSIKNSTARLEKIPAIQINSDLPIAEKSADIAALINAHQVVIVCGETGSGKTTQLPKICLQMGRGHYGYIGHTQPRRLAARSVAQRIGEELGKPAAVGYKIRFADNTQPDSLVKLLTDGMLLAELRNDTLLEQYDTLIIDEAHERSLNIDFLLGLLCQLLPKRPDLKLIITSATIDPDRFSKHFNNAPIISVEGRGYPVDILYRPLSGDEDEQESGLAEAISEAATELWRNGGGDILVFLAGEREIRETNDYLTKSLRDCEILPLFSRLSNAEQQRIFAPHKRRRIILATNVAETSLTVPGISYVIDAGTARISRYSPSSKIQRLPIEKISQASAMQRSGRCGRLGSGICIRLYSEEDFELRPAYTDPEIQRTNLAAVILQMSALNLGNIEDFPFIDAPQNRYINDGYRLLQELDAMDGQQQLTQLGRRLAKLPIDPRLARVLMAADALNCLSEATIIVAVLEIQDPRERPLQHAQAADTAHKEFTDKNSDFLALLNLWNAYHEKSKEISKNQLRRWCKEHFVSALRMHEWQDLHKQLGQLCRDLKLSINSIDASYQNLHQALLCGFPSQVAKKDEEHGYLAARNRKLQIFPGSGVKKQPPWLVCAEIAETSRVFARCVAQIESEWISQQCDHLLKKSHNNPRWSKKPGRVIVDEQASLYGLIIYANKKVAYAPINADQAQHIFIEDGLVTGEIIPQPKFVQQNLQQVADIEALEDMARRRDLLVETQLQVDFYKQQLPDYVFDQPSLKAWLKSCNTQTLNQLLMPDGYLLDNENHQVTEELFPKQFISGNSDFELRYRFEPNHPEDGVTLLIPVKLLNQLNSQLCDWLVPGLLLEKITCLIRGLPKSLRKNFVPVPEFAEACHDAVDRHLDFYESIRGQLLRMTGVDCPIAELRQAELPTHLIMRYEILASDSSVLDHGRDFHSLYKRWQKKSEQQIVGSEKTFERHNIIDWDFGELNEEYAVKQGEQELLAFPALRVEAGQINLRLMANQQEALKCSRLSVRELIKLKLKTEASYLRKNIPRLDQLCLKFAPIANCDVLIEDIINASFESVFIDNKPLPRSHLAFTELLQAGKPALIEQSNRICHIVTSIINSHHEIRQQLARNKSQQLLEQQKDIQSQLQQLIYPGFITASGDLQLQQIPRYLSAVEKRLVSLELIAAQDSQRQQQIAPLWQSYIDLVSTDYLSDEARLNLEKLHWMLEELRVSIFAQTLGTLYKISVPRVEKQLSHCQILMR